MKAKNQKGNKKAKAPEGEDEEALDPPVDEDDDNDDGNSNDDDNDKHDDNDDNDDDEEDSSESGDDGELALEGELRRDPDASTSSSDDDDGDINDNDSEVDENEKKHSTKNSKDRKRKTQATEKSDGKSSKKTKSKRARKEEDLDKVEFIFCEMDEKYFEGCKALLINASSVYRTHASTWTDWITEQVLGTVVSTSEAYSAEDNLVFGFASFINLQKKASTADAAMPREQCLSFLQKHALDGCPDEYLSDMKKLFESKACPFYLFLHGRMMNLPLEIVLVLHQQLWLDWEYAEKDGEESENVKNKKKKATKKTAASPRPSVFSDKDPRMLRVAPCTKSKDGMLVYRYYDDELLASRAIVSYTVKAPPSYSKEEAQFLQVLVFTPENYSEAIQDLEVLVGK